jgi:ATP-dependent Lhr-like helicase
LQSGWESAVLAHKGSRQLRLDAEEKLKRGELRAVVATASLGWGSISAQWISFVDRVADRSPSRCSRSGARQADPNSIRVDCSQRHAMNSSAQRWSIPFAPDGWTLEIPGPTRRWPADCRDGGMRPWVEGVLFDLVSAYPYRNLKRTDFNSVVEMLSEESRQIGAAAGVSTP